MSGIASAESRQSGDDIHLKGTETPLRIGRVVLTVRDLDGVSSFYQRVIGLAPIATSAEVAELGAGGKVLLELRRDKAAAASSQRDAGLFHTAFLVPTRNDLARWLLHVASMGGRIQGASDHIVSEAIYLADPEGNGIEVYRDKDPASWTWHDRTVEMATDRLDLDELVQGVDPGRWSGMPERSCVGHVHLRVGAIPQAEAFYQQVIGLDLTARYPGGSFYASGGYHHHVATNIWSSRGAGPRGRPSTGLDRFEILAGDEATWDRISHSALAAGGETATGGAVTVLDPWNNAIVVDRA